MLIDLDEQELVKESDQFARVIIKLLKTSDTNCLMPCKQFFVEFHTEEQTATSYDFKSKTY
jgi:hypothetical protein